MELLSIRTWEYSIVTFLHELPRRWVAIALPGVGDTDRPHATYESFSQIPVAPADASQLEWLRGAKAWDDSAMALACESAVADISLPTMTALVGDAAPSDLMDFIANPDLRKRLPTATDAYFDLGEEVRTVDGGRLLHLVSDSQWVMHWSIYIGDDGQTAVVASDYPVGFHLDEGDREYWSGAPSHYFLCALSFGEFAWRWWMDNEIFYRSTAEKLPLTRAQQNYLDEYGEPSSLE
jgi:hypothetical protein